jgi:CheY-like chemotaxis protein
MAKVLLCDDEEALCRGMARLLRTVSYEVVTADGPGGLERLERENFDAVVTDLRMPGVDGFGILDAVRLKSPMTPVIVMSGSAEVTDAVRAMRAGARDFFGQAGRAAKPGRGAGQRAWLLEHTHAVDGPRPHGVARPERALAARQ